VEAVIQSAGLAQATLVFAQGPVVAWPVFANPVPSRVWEQQVVSQPPAQA
jgi:hypothetical protein